jgi:membrane fusion protein (multidrug efflux system)
MSKRPIFFYLLLSLGVLHFSCNNSQKEKKDKPAASKPQGVDVFVIHDQPLEQTMEVPGSLIANEETEIHPEISGRVTDIYFKEGAAVSKGTVLVKLYDEDLQAQLKKIQVQLSIAKKTEERQRQLLNINGISQQDYDLSLLSVNNLMADIDILKTSISKTAILAPYNGTIGLRNISPGAFVTTATAITTIRDNQRLKLDFSVPEKYSGILKQGQVVYFKTDEDTLRYAAKVVATENNISAATRTLHVRAGVNSNASKFLGGEFAKVQITLNKNQNTILIPTQAIIPQARNKKVVLLKDGMTSMKQETTGYRDADVIEITDGLKIGDTILLSGLMRNTPGSKVIIKSVKTN